VENNSNFCAQKAKLMRDTEARREEEQMGHELIEFPKAGALEERILQCLEKVTTIFAAIDAGELLAALPDCPVAQKNHTTALNLLSIVEGEIRCLCAELSE
jgi:hypothetical protein